MFGDAGVLYFCTAPRDGVDDYYYYSEWFFGDSVFLTTSDVVSQNGLVRLALAGDFSSFESVHIEEMTIEVKD